MKFKDLMENNSFNSSFQQMKKILEIIMYDSKNLFEDELNDKTPINQIKKDIDKIVSNSLKLKDLFNSYKKERMDYGNKM